MNSDSTYGGLKKRNCHQMLLRNQINVEYCTIMRTPMILADVDAAGCYDRQRTALIGMVTQQNGLPRSISECQTKTWYTASKPHTVCQINQYLVMIWEEVGKEMEHQDQISIVQMNLQYKFIQNSSKDVMSELSTMQHTMKE